MSEQTIRIGISTCPNDTFAFHGLLTGNVKTPGVNIEFELLDVQQLNEKLISGKLEVAKGSFHAGLLQSAEIGVLDSGSAVGFGVGPLLLSATAGQHPSDTFEDQHGNHRQPLVLCPGQQTTANLLYKLLFPQQGVVHNLVFSEIMPQLQNGSADFGVCIHEGRFTWQAEGLGCVADLGDMWEQKTNMPLPLGGIFARHSLGEQTHQMLNEAIRRSVEYGWQHREETLQTMRKHAQELSDEVIFAHVDLYVNDWTLSQRKTLASATNLKAEVSGEEALTALHHAAVETGVIQPGHPQLKVLG